MVDLCVGELSHPPTEECTHPSPQPTPAEDCKRTASIPPGGGRLNTGFPLLLGGKATFTQAYPHSYSHTYTDAFQGCVRNLRVNGEVGCCLLGFFYCCLCFVYLFTILILLFFCDFRSRFSFCFSCLSFFFSFLPDGFPVYFLFLSFLLLSFIPFFFLFFPFCPSFSHFFPPFIISLAFPCYFFFLSAPPTLPPFFPLISSSLLLHSPSPLSHSSPLPFLPSSFPLPSPPLFLTPYPHFPSLYPFISPLSPPLLHPFLTVIQLFLFPPLIS